jgi:hypothetical protein
MLVYRERFRVPAYWWPLALVLVVLSGTELLAGLPWPVATAGYGVLTAAFLAALLLSSRTVVEVRDGELRAGRSRLPLDHAGGVTALDEAQTRLLRGPRADPAAFVLTRPYLKRAVYIEVPVAPPAGGSGDRPRAAPERGPAASAGGPYWLVGSRHPEELAAAIGKSRPAARAGGVHVG